VCALIPVSKNSGAFLARYLSAFEKWNFVHPVSLAGMTNDDIAAKINSQIDQIQRQMRAHQRVIKHNLDKTLIIEAAETELKALKTRLKVLKGNLAKLEPA
jgi:hypothetical protein